MGIAGLCFTVALLAPAPGQFADRDQLRPPAEFRSHVILELSLDKTLYLLSEPVRARIVLKNLSTEPFIGPFTLSPLLPRARVRYSLPGGQAHVMTSGLEGRAADSIELLQELPGAGTLQSETWLAFDHRQSRPPFPVAGRYDVSATFTVLLRDLSRCELRSNTVRIDVRPPEGMEVPAHEAYTPELARLPVLGVLRDEHFPQALAFVRRFPTSVYTRAIAELVVGGIRERLKRPDLPSAERRDLESALEALEPAVSPPRVSP